jgi:hypothetical protein
MARSDVTVRGTSAAVSSVSTIGARVARSSWPTTAADRSIDLQRLISCLGGG